FGSAAIVESIHARIRAEGEHDGIAFAFERMDRFPNTYLAHRAVAMAAGAGPAAQDAAAEALFSGYFEHGLDIGDVDTVATALRAPDAAVADRPVDAVRRLVLEIGVEHATLAPGGEHAAADVGHQRAAVPMATRLRRRVDEAHPRHARDRRRGSDHAHRAVVV